MGLRRRRLTRPVLRLGCSAFAIPFCDLWIRTQWSGHLDTLCWVVILIFSCDDSVRRDPLFDPSFEGGIDVMVGVIHGAEVHHISEEVRPRAASAVHHAWCHEQPVEVLRLVETSHLLYHAVIVIDGVEGRWGAVVPTVILEKLSAVRAEGGQIGIFWH
jgi:hypothetical protein